MSSQDDQGPTGILSRAFAILERLATAAQGLPMQQIADELGIPRSATHRLLTNLAEHGYVRQDRDRGFYLLTTKLLSLAFSHLGASGIADTAQPVLDRLAAETGELARLSVVDGDRLCWVAKAQGATSGLRYDPDMGMEARLSCSATGFALLSCMTDDDALKRAAVQGYGKPDDFGPEAPGTPEALLQHLHQTRMRGYALAIRTYADWMAAAAAPVRRPGTGEVIGVISIAGPAQRLTEQRLIGFAPRLLAAVEDLTTVLPGSPLLSPRGKAA